MRDNDLAVPENSKRLINKQICTTIKPRNRQKQCDDQAVLHNFGHAHADLFEASAKSGGKNSTRRSLAILRDVCYSIAMKIWAKVMKGDKILRDAIYEDGAGLNPASYKRALQDVCYTLDVSTPVTLPSHYKHFERFNRVKYLPRDFVEDVDFTAYILERVVEKKKPENYLV